MVFVGSSREKPNGWAALAIMALLGGSCHGGGPASPAPPQCRTYVAEFTRQVVKPDFTSPPETSRCTFDVATSTLTCTGPYTISAGCPGMVSTAFVWSSVADFVTEVDTVGKTLNTEERETVNYAPGCGFTGTIVAKLTYDPSVRLTSRYTSAAGAADFLEMVYTAWDTAGRPTAGTERSTATSCGVTASYNDSGRTHQTTVTCDRSSGTEVVTLDANGNIVRMQTTKNGAVSSTETRTINRTQTACR